MENESKEDASTTTMESKTGQLSVEDTKTATAPKRVEGDGDDAADDDDDDKKSCSVVPKRSDGTVLLSHVSLGTKASASSVLQKNIKLYGPMNALNCDDALTCWNSEGNLHDKSMKTSASKGSSRRNSSSKSKHSFMIDFQRPVVPVELCIQFQAGFVAEEMTVLWKKNNKTGDTGESDEWVEVDEYEIDDDHDIQSFPLQEQLKPGKQQQQQHQDEVTAIKLLFEECTDFFDRVTIYILQVWGREVSS